MIEWEEDDLPFMSPEERAEALGIEASPVSKARFVGPVTPGTSTLQPPPPGWIEVKLAEVARSRGIVNPKGPYAGQVSLSALVRGTNLAATTIHPLLHAPESRDFVHFTTVARICGFLKCQPGELMVYNSGKRK